jgi:hypothetical protein
VHGAFKKRKKSTKAPSCTAVHILMTIVDTSANQAFSFICHGKITEK